MKRRRSITCYPNFLYFSMPRSQPTRENNRARQNFGLFRRSSNSLEKNFANCTCIWQKICKKIDEHWTLKKLARKTPSASSSSFSGQLRPSAAAAVLPLTHFELLPEKSQQTLWPPPKHFEAVAIQSVTSSSVTEDEDDYFFFSSHNDVILLLLLLLSSPQSNQLSVGLVEPSLLLPLASTHCLGLIIDAPFEGRRRRRRFQGPSSSHILPGPRGQKRSEQMESRHTLKLLLLGLSDVASLPCRFTLSSYRNSFSRQQQRGTTALARSAGPHLTHCSSSLSSFPFLLILSLSPSSSLTALTLPSGQSCAVVVVNERAREDLESGRLL